MKFNKDDIELSKIYLLNLDTANEIDTDNHTSDQLLNDIIDVIIYEGESDLIKGSVFTAITSLPFDKQAILKKKLIEEVNLQTDIQKAFRQEQRNDLKQKLIQFNIDKQLETDSEFEKQIALAFKLENRKNLKEQLKERENKVAVSGIELRKATNIENKNKLSRYLKVASIAAIFISILVIWQPSKMNNQKLFAYSISETRNQSLLDNNLSNQIIIKNKISNTRGSGIIFKKFTESETVNLLKALELFEQNKFEDAKVILSESKLKERNPEFLIYLAITQLYTNETDLALSNLEYLNGLSEYAFKEDVKFYLALCYIKYNKNKEARILLKSLTHSSNIYSEKASNLLKKMRWF